MLKLIHSVTEDHRTVKLLRKRVQKVGVEEVQNIITGHTIFRVERYKT